MQIVKYDVQGNILEVGFREDDFVVYTQIVYDKNKSKEELLQLAYIQAKSSIDYERTLQKHSFTTEEKGEEFIPEESRPTKLEIDFYSLKGKVLDQYGGIYSTDIEFSIEGTDKARIENDVIIEDEVKEDEEYFIVAKYNDLVEKQKRIIYASKPDELDLLQQQISDINNKIAKRYEIDRVKGELLEVQNFIVNQQYNELLNKGGM